MNAKITERQQMPNGTKEWLSAYRFMGKDKASGLYVFQESDGPRELFAYRPNGVSGWHIVRNGRCFEFCRSDR